MYSSVAGRTRNQMKARFLEMYQEQSKIKNRQPKTSQSSNQDKQNEVEENHAKGNKGVTAEHVRNGNLNGIDKGKETAPDKMVDDSDEEMSSDSSGSETENSDDEDFNIHEDSDKEDSDSSTNSDDISSDESSSETDEDDVLVPGKIRNDDYDGKVIELDSDEDDKDDKDGRDEINARGASSSAYRKEEENMKSKRKGHRGGREVLKVGKGPVKEILNEEDSDCEGKREVAEHGKTKVQERRNSINVRRRCTISDDSSSDESSSETDDDDEDAVLGKTGSDSCDGKVIEIDSDDDDKDEIRKPGASSSAYRKEEESWRSSRKFKVHHDDRQVIEGKGAAKEGLNDEIDKDGRDAIKERGASKSKYRKEEESWSSKKSKGHHDEGKGAAKESLSEEIGKDGRDEIKERGASSSTYRKEEESWKSSKKFKGHRNDREVLKVEKGPLKKSLNKEDSECESKKDAAADGAGKQDSEKKVRRQKKSSQAVNILVESIVHGSRDAAQDTEPPSESSTTLPLKFRFPDSDDEIEPEKDEGELECERLFDEMYFHLKYEKPADTHNHESEDEVEHYPEAKRSAETICSEEGHDTYLDEEIGVICNRCNKVVTEIKDVMPSFAKDTRDAFERRRYIYGQESSHDKFDFRGPEDDEQNLDSHTIGTVWSLIPGIKKNMYPHQQEGFEFLWKNMAGTINLDELKKDNDKVGGGCIISHAPGTGKTRLTIIFLQTYLKMFPQCYPVIIAPAGMLLTWEEEFKKWNFEFPFHNLNNPEFSGKECDSFLKLVSSNKCQDMKVARLVKLGSWSEGKSVLGISYSLYGKKTKKEKAGLGYQDEQVRKVLLERPKLVILDEGHTPRNKKSSIWKSCLELQTERRIILSGTPFQNSFDELFNTLELVRPSLAKALDKKLRFADVQRQSASKYSRKRLRYEEPSSDLAIERLKVAMAPFVHVHKGSILQESLPGLRDAVILLKPSELQKKLIEGNKLLQKKELQGTFEFEYHEAMVSVHPCLSKDKGSSLIEKNKLEKIRLDYDEGVKTKFTVALIQLSLTKPEKEKVLVFSQYIDPLDLIKDQLSEHLGYGSSEVLQLQGDIDQKSRKNMIDKFNDPNSSAKVMLASTKCCSEGISLVGASRVVLLDVAWNPSVESQAISRAFRIGQNRVVYTYHLMTSGTTEVDKYCRQVEKDRLSELVFAQNNSEKRWKRPVEISDDVILEKMLENERLKGMFQEIIHQPKEKKLLECFGIPSHPQEF